MSATTYRNEWIEYFLWVCAGILCLPLLLLKRTNAAGKILVTAHAKIGDFVDQLMVCRAIKAKYPASKITVLITNPLLAGLVACDPAVNSIIVWNEHAPLPVKIRLLVRLVKENYTWSINLSCQAWLDFIALFCLIPNRVTALALDTSTFLRHYYHLIGTRHYTFEQGGYGPDEYLRLLSPLGITTGERDRSLSICPKNDEFVRKYAFVHGFNKDDMLIGIAISCGSKIKLWPEPHFIRLCSLLLVRYPEAKILLLGWHEDSTHADRIKEESKGGDRVRNTCGEFFLGEFAALATRLTICIGSDTGTMHIADAVHTPVVVITGPVDSNEVYLPDNPRVRLAKPAVQCAPCSFRMASRTVCPLPESRSCLIHTTPEQVFNHTVHILELKGNNG